jgi:dipeptidyl aminopeptidase/acylaminoacyl peptidase
MIGVKMTKRLFEAADMFRFEYMPEAQLSPDGTKIVYVLLRTDEAKDSEFSNLWLLDVQSKTATQLTNGEWTDNSPVWSPDGASIAFLSTREKKPQIFLFSLANHQTRQLTTFSQGCTGALIWSPDGKRLAFSAKKENQPDPSQPRRITRPIYRFDAIGYVDSFVKQIHVLDLESGQTTPLTQGEWNHSPLAWSPAGNELLYLANLNPDSIFTSANIHAVDMNGNSRLILSNEWGIIQNAAWLKDGKIAFAGVPAGKIYGSKNDLFVMNSDGSDIECRTASLPNIIDGRLHDDFPVPWGFGPARILPADDSSEAILCTLNGGEVNMIRVALRGAESIQTIASGKRFCFPFNRVDHSLLFGIATPFDPTQLSLLNLSTLEESRLTSLNKELLDQLLMPEMRDIRFKSTDGADVEGWIMLPQGEAPFPTVLHIHGGPHAAYGYSFFFDFLSLTSAGYAVLLVNYRGSTGYGDSFATAINQDWGNLDHKDLMAGVDHAIALGIADPDRLGCCGVSAGGFHSCWIAATTHRFKAAVPENVLTNWVSFYGTADIGPVFAVREMGGKPHEVPENYRRCSPITYAHQCTTPTLLIVCEEDCRCPAEQAEQFYTTLKTNGCTVEMIRMPNSFHDDSTYGPFASRRVHNEALIEWMDKYVK